MFQVPEGTALKQQTDLAEKNYTIQKYDYLEAQVYTNGGEKIIDPEFRPTTSEGTGGEAPQSPRYFIDATGVTKLPMVGEIKLEGLTIRQAEEVLQQAYSKFYADAFVVLKYTNKRVVVLGAPGGQVVPLSNEGMHLVEILALVEGIPNDGKATNIRILRGDQVMVADLSTFDGYVKNNILIQPGDVIYVEPIRRPFTESVRDYGPIVSIVTTITTLIVVIVGL